MKSCSLLPPSSGKKRGRQDHARSSSTTSPSCNLKDLDIDEKIDNPVDFLRALFSRDESTTAWLQEQKQYSFNGPSQCVIESYDLAVVRAIREGSIDKLRDMLQQGRKFDASNKFGESLIHMACRRADLNVIQFLVEEAGVRVDVRDDFGRTILHDACWTSKPNPDVMSFLLKKVPPSMLLMEDVRGHTPFHYSRREHWPTWIAFLREHSRLIFRRISIMQAMEIASEGK